MSMYHTYEQLKQDLLLVRNPARYCGGEYHLGVKHVQEGDLHVAVCFPDLYEIGMSNHAMRILYDLFNRMEGVCCDRVFAVAPDFEKLLREKQVPLYTLDEGRPLKELDLLAISLGYELCATNILQVLELGGIPLHTGERGEGDPIVIMGGPASTNPAPFARFIDFSYIGEAENGMEELVGIIRRGKQQGKPRKVIVEELKSLDFLWYPGKKLALRRIDEHFTDTEDKLFQYYVVPGFQVAQDNGIVEIMRGCPNGCRFCHAGQYYKPYRQKSQEVILAQVEQNVHQFGFREVTLSSLSSGDYPHIKELIQNLNNQYMAEHISFSLPSLKVSTFNLDVLEQLSEVRKSGLTFAIETPIKEWQQSVNKLVDVETIIDIITVAKQRGWKLAKFYFMVGLPLVDRAVENQAIVDYLAKIWDATHIHMHINVGTFVPKAHSPYQWAAQLTESQSYEQLSTLKRMVTARIPGTKLSYHEPFTSYIEGLVSRGDGRFGDVIERAYRKGCRLDAWDEYLDKDSWREAIAEAGFPVDEKICGGFDVDESLPWDSVSLRVGKPYLKNEYLKAKERLMTVRCDLDCQHQCGACSKRFPVQDEKSQDIRLLPKRVLPTLPVRQVVFTYRRDGRALYISHINAMRNWEMAFQRSGLFIQFTQGFNPKPRMEFVNPLSLGFKGEEEVMMAEIGVVDGQGAEVMRQKLQESLNEGYTLLDAFIIPPDTKTGRKESLAPYMTGSLYLVDTFGKEPYESALAKSEFATKAGEGRWSVKTPGETNLVKSVFGKDVDKFKVASDISITRTKLFAGSWDDDFLSFFRKKYPDA